MLSGPISGRCVDGKNCIPSRSRDQNIMIIIFRPLKSEIRAGLLVQQVVNTDFPQLSIYQYDPCQQPSEISCILAKKIKNRSYLSQSGLSALEHARGMECYHHVSLALSASISLFLKCPKECTQFVFLQKDRYLDTQRQFSLTQVRSKGIQ